ncbi:MAG: chemotaxis protein CheB [Thermodesulfobacteriota bacterium]
MAKNKRERSSKEEVAEKTSDVESGDKSGTGTEAENPKSAGRKGKARKQRDTADPVGTRKSSGAGRTQPREPDLSGGHDEKAVEESGKQKATALSRKRVPRVEAGRSKGGDTLPERKHRGPGARKGKPGDKLAQADQAKETKSLSERILRETVVTGPNQVDFPIVAIGASAGGLEAFEAFFTNMPPYAGMAFVIIQHLDPSHKSILADLIRRYTKMEVRQVVDRTKIEQNRVYVIPPNANLAVLHGTLHLLDPVEQPGLRTPIDYFFRSLAEDQKERSICIVLSGTGSEGALGLRAIKGEGGMGMVQDPLTAKYDGMPKNAIATGLADYVLPPEKMPAQLIDYVEHTREGRVRSTRLAPKTGDLLDKVFILVREHTGHDFSLYKHNTILRRIDRRMAINRVRALEDYIRILQNAPEEARVLFKELLIGVTSFFRDPEAFEALKKKALMKLIRERTKNRPLRIWVPGCATGEEAYSIAMIARECMDSLKTEVEVQVFATDIDAEAIEAARTGIYPQSIVVDVNEERLRRFFVEADGSLQVKKDIRDKLVFAIQNVVADPPFSKLDLVSCRNLMIYLTSELQRKLIPLFHYALRKDGYLFLGTAETVGEFGDLFSTEDRKWKLFKRREKDLTGEDVAYLPILRRPDARDPRPILRLPAAARGINYSEAVDRLMLDMYSPAGVVVNVHGEILYVHGRTGRFLEMAPGHSSMNVVTMAREGLRLELAGALRKATGLKREIRCEGVKVVTNGGEERINLVVKPFHEPQHLKETFMVIFEEVHEKPQKQDSPALTASDGAQPRVKELEQELKATREYLQSTIEELETANEELKSTNEELQSSNEEMQSTNEELETSKEELQSVNEELATVNTELQQKIDDLSKASSDMQNLLASTQVSTIFLDTGLRIRRFTQPVTDFIPLIASDEGRPLSHVATNLHYDRLVLDAQEVLRTLVPIEKEVQSHQGQWYIMRVLPYRTVHNVIDGVVITFSDVTKLKTALNELEKTRLQQYEVDRRCKFVESIVNTVRESLIVLDQDLKVVFANESFYRFFGVDSGDIEGKPFFSLGNYQWDVPAVRQLLEGTLSQQTSCEDVEVHQEFEHRGSRTLLLCARGLKDFGAEGRLILLTVEDVTDRRK